MMSALQACLFWHSVSDHVRMKVIAACWLGLLQVCDDLTRGTLVSSNKVHVWLLNQRGELACDGLPDAACATDADNGGRGGHSSCQADRGHV